MSCIAMPDRALEQHRRGRLLCCQFPHIGAPCRHRNPMPLARREQPALHPRCHVPGGSVPYPSQSRRLRQATLLRLQHPASQSDFNVQSGSLRRRSRRCQRTPQVDLQLRALNSRGSLNDRRNRLAHDARFKNSTRQRIERLEMVAKGDLKFGFVEETVGDLHSFCEDVDKARDTFLAIWAKILPGLGELPPAPRTRFPRITFAGLERIVPSTEAQ